MARGSKPGERRGGRQKGTPNKRTTELYAKLSEGEMPLEFMLRVMRDPGVDWPIRFDAAKAAAPYCHPRLAATEITGKDGGPLEFKDMSDLDLAKQVAHVLTVSAHKGQETRH